MEELRTYCKIPDDIDLKLMDKPDESTLGGEHNSVFFYPKATCCRALFPCARHCQTIFALHQGVPDPYSSQRNLDSYRMQCSELLIPDQPFIGRDLFRLLSGIRERGPDVLVDTGLPDAVREWAPRFS